MVWNPWHGCHKKSAGCLNCYMFRRDSMYEKDSTLVTKTNDYNLAVRKHRDKSFYIPSGDIVYTCMTSDFFIEEADEWRDDIWYMIKLRQDLEFVIITKRIERFMDCIPNDWEDGYSNVTICATCENQAMADERIPILLDLPIKFKELICEPLLSDINLEKYLSTGKIRHITCGGESGPNARTCDYSWVLHIKDQCAKYNVPFYFKQTGANFLKDGKLYKVPRKLQLSQAKKANINLDG